MAKYIDKDALLAEIERRYKLVDKYETNELCAVASRDELVHLMNFIDTLEVKEVGVWETVDTINPPQADRNKIYCVLSKNKYLLARVIEHPQDEDLLQWRCTEFPFHRYDMCEGDKYMQIV